MGEIDGLSPDNLREGHPRGVLVESEVRLDLEVVNTLRDGDVLRDDVAFVALC